MNILKAIGRSCCLFLALSHLFGGVVMPLWAAKNPGVAIENGKSVEDIKRALIRIQTTCEYQFELTGFAFEPRTVTLTFTGLSNGVIVAHKEKSDFALTARHGVLCDETKKDFVKKVMIDPVLKDVLAKQGVDLNSVFYVSGKRIGLSFFYEDQRYTRIKVVKSLRRGDDIDVAAEKSVVEIEFPEGVLHEHLPILDDESTYGILTPVVVWGYHFSKGQWGVQAFPALILEKDTDKGVLIISGRLLPGFSGSPLLFFFNGTYYVLGVVVSVDLERNLTFIVRIQPSFLESVLEK